MSQPQPDPANELKRMTSSITTARIETLADGVFAIVMTVLVFDLRVPVQEQVDQVGLLLALSTLAPNFISYVITFVILGVFWVGHHNQFFYIRRADRTLLWINILFMGFVALLPFSAGLFSQYGQDRVSIIVYNINLICAGLVLFLHWWYATRDSHLLSHPIEEHARRIVYRRILTPPCFYFLAILVSLFHVEFSIIIDVLVPIIYILPPRMDRIFRRG
ncbi:MAG: TMEM175 family protein [Chloroflexota bacterium]